MWAAGSERLVPLFVLSGLFCLPVKYFPFLCFPTPSPARPSIEKEGSHHPLCWLPWPRRVLVCLSWSLLTTLWPYSSAAPTSPPPTLSPIVVHDLLEFWGPHVKAGSFVQSSRGHHSGVALFRGWCWNPIPHPLFRCSDWEICQCALPQRVGP